MEVVWRVLTRRKILDPVSTEETQLGRVLNTFDLTALGVGSTLGVGVYVLAGHVAKDVAGPAVILSFLIAAVASVFAGLCYAEFGARAPRAGSAYIYSYVCVGEFIAFIIGWNLILEYVIGSASVARGLSLYLDSLLNNTMEKAFIDVAPMHVDFLSAYFDFFAFGISILLAIALAFGMKESSFVNNVFTILNIAVVIFVIIAGSIKADGRNWNLSPYNNATIHGGSGGFFPFGIEGMIKGAATCFYGFVGFDCIATTGEEVKNPKKAIPISIIVSLFIIFLAYFGTSTVVTLMVPYYLQDPDAPIPHAFELIGWEVPKWIVAIGGIFGLCASLFGAMFPLPRIIYAMASDGIIFRTLGKISEKFKTPVIGTLIAGTLTGLMAAMFELKQLVNMMSIGTLLAYTIVAASVLLLSYEVQENRNNRVVLANDSDDSDTYTDNRTLNEMGSNEEIALISDNFTSASVVKQLFNSQRHQEPTKVSERLVSVQVFIYCIFCVLIGLCAMYLKTPISKGEVWAIILTAIIVCVAVFLIISIAAQPKSKKELSFKVPFVPVIPALSILINIYLMLMLDSHTWIRFAVWMAIGIPTYYFSVKNHYDTRNMSVANISVDVRNGGVINKGFDADRLSILENAKKNSSSVPSPENIRSTIAVLDEILDNETSKFDDSEIDRSKFSKENESEAGVPMHEEHVEVDVHNVVTPVAEKGEMTLQQQSDSVSNTALARSESWSEISDGIDEEKIVEKGEQNVEEDSKKDARDDDDEHKIVETAEESNDSSLPAIPVPPPLMTTETDGFKTFFNTLIGPDFINALHSTKLKHIDTAADPPVDDNTVDEEAHNFKFGTPEHTAFLEKLNENLKRQSLPVNYVAPSVVEVSRNTKSVMHVPHDNVVEDHIDRVEAKVKLAELLEKSPLVLSPDFIFNHHMKEEKPAEIVSPKEEKAKTDYKEQNLEDFTDKEQHRHNMKDLLFGSLNFRNVDDSKERTEQFSTGDKDESNTNKDDMSDFKEQHKRNMKDIFGSLKLRRVDGDNDDDHQDQKETQDEEEKQEAERRENEDLSDFKKQHRLDMANIFGSIQSRNVDNNDGNKSEQNIETNQNRNSNEKPEENLIASEEGTLISFLKSLGFGKTDESDKVEQ